MGQSLASFVTTIGQGKYSVFLICSQEKHLFQKNQEKLRKILDRMCMNPVQESLITVVMNNLIILVIYPSDM